jgi:hypothetical protein
MFSSGIIRKRINEAVARNAHYKKRRLKLVRRAEAAE